MVWEIHVNRDNISPAMDRELQDYYGKSFLQPDYKPAALPVSDTIGHVDPDHEEMSWNFKLGGSTPLEKIVVPEKTGIICDKVVENLSDIRPPPVPRPNTSYVKIAQSNTIQSCQWKEGLCKEEKDNMQSENRKSTVVAVKGTEKVTDKDEDPKTSCRSWSFKTNNREMFPQEKQALRKDEVMEKVTNKDEGQKTIGKRTFSKKNSGKKFPQEKPALTWDKGKFMVFIESLIFAVYWFANDKKLKPEEFTWLILKGVLNYISSILSFTKKSPNKIYVSLEHSNSMRIDVKPDKNEMGTSKWTTTNTDGNIDIVAFNGKVRSKFRRNVYLENETSIRISNLSFEEWNSYWTYQKGTGFPVVTKKLAEYVDPVCSDNFTVVGSSKTSITVMWDSGIDRGHHMITILQYCVDESSDWMSAYNTTEHFNQEVNFSIPDLKLGTSYHLRLLTLEGNGSRLICESNLLTEKTKPDEQTRKKSYDVKLIVVAVVGSLILFFGMLIFCGYQRLHSK
ncbi:TTN [Mytilus coruscus]|uniref:TTN n=1 Tax=Mytilus coruscus TaxID=42192 RepID=A0A6J8DR53_MYTCO|nr:TTN [Mytilus coruscus]